MNGAVLYEGPSLIDGEPVVALASGMGRPSSNTKTGVMIQTWILRSDIAPYAALNCGADRSVCGDCPLRGDTSGGTARGRACYVNVAKAVTMVFDAYRRGSYCAPDNVVRAIASHRATRLGGYGEPTAVPLETWNPLLQGAGWTGYTHRWREAGPEWAAMLMASVDSPEEYAEARNAGWRTFRTRLKTEPLLPGEMVCPASPEGGNRTQCERCLLCKGGKRGPSVAIIAHGQGARAYERWKNS